MFIITNGKVYDIYIRGSFATQISFCPTKELCAVLLDSKDNPVGG